jgi:hypothetical protein
MFDDLITYHAPPPNRVIACEADVEHHLSEAAVMLAFAMHLLRTVPGLMHVEIHPDGEHGKRFDFQGWLQTHDFTMMSPLGSTSYGGMYSDKAGRTLTVSLIPGRGDVVAEMDGQSFVAECKGGVINTKHSGQTSRLRKGLCETVGLSLATPIVVGRRQFVVVPKTRTTDVLARKMAHRAQQAGISIALVDGRGNIFDIRADDAPEMNATP